MFMVKSSVLMVKSNERGQSTYIGLSYYFLNFLFRSMSKLNFDFSRFEL